MWFKINDQRLTTIGGVPLRKPQASAMYSGYPAAITVLSLAIGEQAAGPITIYHLAGGPVLRFAGRAEAAVRPAC